MPEEPLSSRLGSRPGRTVEVAQKLVRDLLHAHFGVAHRRGRVAVDRAEVAVAVDERVAQREVLREADDRVVHRRVAVRVVLADHLADHAGGLDVLDVPRRAELVHREEAAPVHRLEAVAHIRQRAPNDDAHGVVEVVPRHLLLDINVLKHAFRGDALGHSGLFLAHKAYYTIFSRLNARLWPANSPLAGGATGRLRRSPSAGAWRHRRPPHADRRPASPPAPPQPRQPGRSPCTTPARAARS